MATSDIKEVEEAVEKKVPGLDEFRVVLQNSHGDTYHPGQMVEGYVVVALSQPLMMRGVMIHFRGSTSIFWSQYTRGRGARCIDRLDFSSREEFFNIHSLVQDAGYLPIGVTKYPFKYHLTPPLPETYEDSLCQIEYFVQARIKLDNNKGRDVTHRHDFLVLHPLDLNEIILPDVTLPVMTQTFGTMCCFYCRSQPITAFLRLSRSGYSPGETIHIQADIENLSRRSIKYTVFRLVEVSEYLTPEKVHVHREVMVSITEGPVRAGETREWSNIPLYIPKQQLYNVNASKIFAIHHILEMEVHPSLSKKRLLLSLNLTLGAVPLEGTVAEMPAHMRLHPPSGRSTFRGTVSLSRARTPDMIMETVPQKTVYQERQRRKVREKKIVPISDEIIDTNGYVRQKNKQKQFKL